MANIFDTLAKGLKSKLGEVISFDDIYKETEKVDQQFSKVANTFGQGRENVLGIKQSLTDAVTEVTLLGGSFESIIDMQTQFSNNIGRSILLSKESFKELYAIEKVTGQGVIQINEAFTSAGMSVLHANKEMQKVLDISRSIGVSVSKVSATVVENLSATNKFNFQGGVESMARMAAQAVNLKMDMRSTLQIAENLFDPDKAIEMAAGLQRLGVQQSALLDPLRLMDLAQNDPEELQNQMAEMSKEFVRLNKESGKFEILPGAKRRLIEIERQLSLTPGSLAKIGLASAELDDKMSKIKLPSNLYTEEQRTFIANMAQMGPGGEYKLKVDNKDLKLDQALELFTKDKDTLDRFMKASEKKTMEQLAEEQLDTSTMQTKYLEAIKNTITYSIAGSRAAEEVLDANRIVVKGLPELFGDKKKGDGLSVESMRTKIDRDADKFFEKMSRGEVVDASFGALKDVAKGIGNQLGNFLGNIDNYVSTITDTNNRLILAAKGFVGGMTQNVETLTGMDLDSKKILDDNKRRLEENKTSSNPLIETNKGGTTTSSETKSNVKVDYDGKIEVIFKPDYGMTEDQFKRFIERPDIQEQLKTAIKNLKLTGENPKKEN